MKKVLIIARYFGTRIPALMKYLPEHGWEPALVAPETSGVKIPEGIRTVITPYRDPLHFWKKLIGAKPEADLRHEIHGRLGAASNNKVMDSLMTLAGAVINYPDSDKGWKSYAIEAGDDLLGGEKFDAMLSSSSPVTAHVIAAALKKRHGVPWLADLRDPWSQNHNYVYGPVRRRFDKRLELRTFTAADALVTVSQPWADNLQKLHRGPASYAITNGFDPDMINEPPLPLTEKMTITYTGKVYPGKQDPRKLFEALRALFDEKTIAPEKIEVRFYGMTDSWLEGEIADYGLKDAVKTYGNVSRDEAIRLQRESHILLLLNWDDPGEKGTIPSKIFEYMATLRPVLATGGQKDDAIQQILRESEAGFHTNSVDEMKEWLRERYKEYTASGETAATGNPRKITAYSQREMARRFADILEKLSGGA